MLVIKHPDGRYLSLWLDSSHTPIWTDELHRSGRAPVGSVEEENMRKTIDKVQRIHREAYIADLPDDFRGPEEAAEDAAKGPWVVEKMYDDVPNYLREDWANGLEFWGEYPGDATAFAMFAQANAQVDTKPGFRRVVPLSEAMDAYGKRIATPPESPKEAPAPVANTVRLADDQLAAIIAAIKATRA